MKGKADYLQKAIKWAQKKAATNLKVESEGYEAPKSFRNADSDNVVAPDITFTRNGTKHYTEIAIKDRMPLQRTVSKWKLMSTLANFKAGKLHLLAPRGHKAFAQRLIEKYNIDAQVHSL